MRLIEFVLIRNAVLNKNNKPTNIPNKNTLCKIYRKEKIFNKWIFSISKLEKFETLPEQKRFLINWGVIIPRFRFFSMHNKWVIAVSKLVHLFLLGTVCPIRTASEKVFLIRTILCKTHRKTFFLVNKVFSYLNLEIFLCVRIKNVCLLIIH